MPNLLSGSLIDAPYTGSVNLEPPSGWVDSYQSGLTTQLMVDNPVTPRLPWFESNTDRFMKTKLQEHYDSGQIPEEDWQRFTGFRVGQFAPRWTELADYANKELGLQDVPTLDDYEKQRQQEYQDVVAHDDEIAANQSLVGKLGSLAGRAHAAAIDPVYALGMMSGYSAGAGALQVALYTGASEGLLEAVAAPMKHEWKTGLGMEHSAADAFTDVITAATGGAILGGAGKVFADVTVKGALKVLNKVGDRPVLRPIRQVLENSDPEASLREVVKMDEGVDRSINTRAIPKDIGGADVEIKEFDISVSDIEERYMVKNRQSKSDWDRTERRRKRQAKKQGETYEMRPYPEKENVVGAEQVSTNSGEKENVINALGIDDTPDGQWMKESADDVLSFEDRLSIIEECF